MIILAIDASTKSTGVAIFEDGKLKHYNCLTASSNDVIKRIQKIIIEMKYLFSDYKIDKIILEEVRPENSDSDAKKWHTQRVLMWLQGAIAMLAHELCPSAELDYVYPSEWRKACGIQTGRGYKRESLKSKDIAFVKKQYGIDVNDDIADAIGIGYGYINSKLEKNHGALNF